MDTHSDTMAAFTYSPLLTPDSLRLLKVQPDLDKATGHICIELQETTRDTPYRCLSYMWGDQTEKFAILVNGCKMLIGKSLFEFLEVARPKFANEPLWVDAVCINQEDNEEKSVQVQSMGKTYAGALEVLIWLGHSPDIVEYFAWVNKPRAIMNRAVDRMHLDPTPKALRKPIIEFATHPYWTRAWVTQELMLTGSHRLLCGEAETRSSLLFSIDHVPTGQTGNGDYFYAASKLSGILRLLLNKYDPDRKLHRSLWSTAASRLNAECQDPRDRLYSLLAIIGHDVTFKVDYGESLVDLYWRAIHHFSAWCSLTHLNILWDLLSMERSLVMDRVQNKGQNLSILVPVRPAKVRLWPHRPLLFITKQSHECANSLRGRGCAVTRFSSCDILLCPHQKDSGDLSTIHFSVRRLRTGSMNALEVHMHSSFWSRMQCPADTELWCIDRVTRRRLETWDDVTSYTTRTSHADEHRENKSHLAVKLSHQYMFDVNDHITAVALMSKWKKVYR
jgi:hypothetical protein